MVTFCEVVVKVGGRNVDTGRDEGVCDKGGVGGAGCVEVACTLRKPSGEGGLKREPFCIAVHEGGLKPSVFPLPGFAKGGASPPPHPAPGLALLPVPLAILPMAAIGLRPERQQIS